MKEVSFLLEFRWRFITYLSDLLLALLPERDSEFLAQHELCELVSHTPTNC